MGSVLKGPRVYERPFWRDADLSGHATADTGFVQITFDQGHPDHAEGVLVGFIDSENCRTASQMTEDQRRDLVVEDLVRLFGEQARHPIAYYDTSWIDEEWSRGCYVGALTPGTWSTLGHALREPIGPTHWAGTETALIWNGYMDGAIRSGEDAAAAILADVTALAR
jgi:monoamine oxidase